MKLLITTLTFLYFITSSVSWGVTMEDLVNKNGIYYSKSSDIPFTGNVTLKTCESNELHCKELVNLKNGKRDGFGLKFWDNGKLRHKINYANGKKNGSIVEHHYNGQLKTKGFFKKNKKDGSLWKEITGEFKHGIRISNNPLN